MAVDESVEESTAKEVVRITEEIENLQVADTGLEPSQKHDSNLSDAEDAPAGSVGEDAVDGLVPKVTEDFMLPSAAEKDEEGGESLLAKIPTSEGAGLPLIAAEEEVKLLDPEEGSYYVAEVILEVLNRYF